MPVQFTVTDPVRLSYDVLVMTSTMFGKTATMEFMDAMLNVAGLESIMGSG